MQGQAQKATHDRVDRKFKKKLEEAKRQEARSAAESSSASLLEVGESQSQSQNENAQSGPVELQFLGDLSGARARAPGPHLWRPDWEASR